MFVCIIYYISTIIWKTAEKKVAETDINGTLSHYESFYALNSPKADAKMRVWHALHLFLKHQHLWKENKKEVDLGEDKSLPAIYRPE